MAAPVGVTLGAQVGVVVPAVLVFGRLPLVSIPANLLAVPVAGFVMLYGLPAGLLAGAVPACSTGRDVPVPSRCQVGGHDLRARRSVGTRRSRDVGGLGRARCRESARSLL